nr:hypothetical protein [Pseudoduganella plicata]
MKFDNLTVIANEQIRHLGDGLAPAPFGLRSIDRGTVKPFVPQGRVRH